MVRSLGLALVIACVAGAAAQAQDCSAVPPKCQRANDKAMQLVNTFPETSGMQDSAVQAYCVLLVGIEVNSFCADEYRAAGKDECAALLDQQVAEYKKSLKGTKASIAASQARVAEEKCAWQ